MIFQICIVLVALNLSYVSVWELLAIISFLKRRRKDLVYGAQKGQLIYEWSGIGRYDAHHKVINATQRSDYSSSSSSCDALECCNNWNRCIPGRCNCLPCMFRYYANYRYMSTLSSVYSRSSTGAASRVCCCCKFLSRFLHNATTATHAQLAAMRKYCALIDIDKYSFWAKKLV